MNLFVLDKDPKKSARMLCDQHVVKMILETTQLLSTTHHLTNSKFKDKVYKPTHINHPVSIWIRDSKENYLWALEHLKEMLKEYTYRYNKTHKSTEILNYIESVPENIPSKGLTNFAQAMPEEYREKDAVKAYRTFYIKDKSRFARWKKKRKPPKWFVIKN